MQTEPLRLKPSIPFFFFCLKGQGNLLTCFVLVNLDQVVLYGRDTSIQI